jgi:hypothetical protein
LSSVELPRLFRIVRNENPTKASLQVTVRTLFLENVLIQVLPGTRRSSTVFDDVRKVSP